MTRSRYSGLISLFLFFVQVCQAQQQETQVIEESLKVLNEVMIHDITSPPVASRNYMYTMLAFYEAARPGDTTFKTYARQLNNLAAFPSPSGDSIYNWQIAGRQAFYSTAFAFVFSKQLFQNSWDSLMRKRPFTESDSAVLERSVRHGREIAAHILAWAKNDQYIQTRSMQRFTEDRGEGKWKQTPPDYMEAVEPNWKFIRPLTFTNREQFNIPPPFPFKDSAFMAEVKEVYETTRKMNRKQVMSAKFWDCNPFATQTVGHMMYSVKKISPAGHWMGITGVAVRKSRQGFQQALLSYSLVAVAMFDGIIAAWAEKYRSNYIRPVTAIQQFISPVWEPLLQTPPFPEYPSGHSVISMAAATVLTKLYGDRYRYTDDSEIPYGLPARKFNSFYEAANEAAMSRLYGGIHFREAIVNGKELGKKVSDNLLDRIKLH